MANGQLGSNHAAVSNSSAYAAAMMAYRLATGGPATAAQTATRGEQVEWLAMRLVILLLA